jgi:hypothetical protein
VREARRADYGVERGGVATEDLFCETAKWEDEAALVRGEVGRRRIAVAVTTSRSALGSIEEKEEMRKSLSVSIRRLSLEVVIPRGTVSGDVSISSSEFQARRWGTHRPLLLKVATAAVRAHSVRLWSVRESRRPAR